MNIVKLLLSCALISGCASNPTSPTPSGNQAYSNICLDCGFDTFFSLKEYTESKETFDTDFKDSSELFSYCNKLFDIYHSYDGINNLKTINDNAGVQPVEVDPLIIKMLDEAKSFYDLSNGEFDITMGNLLHLWHTYREEGMDENEKGNLGKVPSEEELKKASQYKGFDYLQIDHEKNTVYITDPNISLDVGGIAKGFAAEQVAIALEKRGVNEGSNVNAGGNNRTIGGKPDGKPWRIGIQNPHGEGSLLAVDMEGSISSVTSGDYERFYVASNNEKYHHIIDPQTMFPATYFHSVTIFTKDSGAADCLSTALFTMSYEDGKKLLKQYSKTSGQPAYAVWIMDKSKKEDAMEGQNVDNYFVAYSEGLENAMVWR